jgi:RNase P subunit RPR2
MTQKPRSENARVVVCLFCGTHTFVPVSPARDIANESNSGPGITIVRCHVCHKEAPYSASEIFLLRKVALPDGNTRSRAAGL